MADIERLLDFLRVTDERERMLMVEDAGGWGQPVPPSDISFKDAFPNEERPT